MSATQPPRTPRVSLPPPLPPPRSSITVRAEPTLPRNQRPPRTSLPPPLPLPGLTLGRGPAVDLPEAESYRLAPVRRYFSRLALAAHKSAGLPAGPWGAEPVDRFFLALQERRTGLNQDGRACSTGVVTLQSLFHGFAWDE